MNFRRLLFSIIIIPFNDPSSFLDLQYSKIKPNEVKLEKQVQINVDASASPVFYKMETPRVVKKINLTGNVKVDKAINKKEDDSYFQLGIIYEGNYRPSGFVKTFLPEWLLKVLSLSDKYGVGELEFHEASAAKVNLDKSDSIRDIKLNFKTATTIENGKFSMSIKPKKEKILGLWLRADGDESKAKFLTTIKSLEFEN